MERSQYRNKITCSNQSSRLIGRVKIAKCIQERNITKAIKILSRNDVNMLKFQRDKMFRSVLKQISENDDYRILC